LIGASHLRIWWDNETQTLELEPHDTLGYKLTKERIYVNILGEEIPRGKFPASWDKKKKSIVAVLTKS